MGRKLYVGNLPYETGEAELQELFGRAGTVEKVGTPNKGARANASRRTTGKGVEPNSSPRVWERRLQGGAVRDRFSSQMVTQGKSRRRKQ